MSGVVYWLRGVRYDDIRLLALFELRRLLQRTFTEHHIDGVILDLSQPSQRLKQRIVKRIPSALALANRFLKPLLTQHQVGAVK